MTRNGTIDSKTPPRAESSGTVRYQATGLAAPAEIRVDRWGVPHIKAASRSDAFFVQGFNAARDRLWQIDIWRKRGLGLLAADFGPGYLAQDRAARLFLYRGDMETEWTSYGVSDARETVEHFVAGINAFIDLTGREPGLLPQEYTLTDTKPARWEASDVVRIRSHAMVRNLEFEFGRARVLGHGTIADDKARRWVDLGHTPFVPEGVNFADIGEDVLETFFLATAPVTFSKERLAATLDDVDRWAFTDELGEIVAATRAEGSNNWVIAASRSETGRPILASDPHRAYLLPALRYVAHLRAPDLDVIGAGEPALPGISIGHNGKAAFGLTIFPIDQEDLYVYETNPDDPDLYRYGDGWERMRVIEERVVVKGFADQTLTLKFTRHGPVVYEDRNHHKAYGVRTVWLEPGSAPYLSSLGYQNVSTVEAFEQALQSWSVPSVNQVYADTTGHIAWMPASKSPIRPNWDGMVPVPGNGQYEWNGFRSRKDFPREVDPPRGYVASANEMNLPPGPSQQLNIGYEFTEPYRAQRVREVLDSKPMHGLEEQRALQCDDLSIPARRICKHLTGLRSTDADTALGLSLLQPWDWHLADDSAAALLFEVWWMRFLKPALLDLVSTDPKVRPLLAPGDHVTLLNWLDELAPIFGSDPAAKRTERLLTTLGLAVKDCRKRFGDDHHQWKWSGWHHGYFQHPLANVYPEALRDVGPLAQGGSGMTVMSNGYRMSDGRTITGASFRMVVDVGAWDNSVFVNAPGQSGDGRSSHYDDHGSLWSQRDYVPLVYSEEAIARETRLHIMLEPDATKDRPA
jgi:penicillin G amidase